MKTRFLRFLLALLCLAPLGAWAEDIDLFTSTVATGTATAPNMLFVMDNASNFNNNAAGTTCFIDGTETDLSGKTGGVMQCALYDAINVFPVGTTASFNIGIMVFSGTGVKDYTGTACPSSSNGGCLVYPLTGLTNTTKPILLAWIKAWKNSGSGAVIGGSGRRNAAVMQEAWAYYAGRTGISGKDYVDLKPPIGCLKNFIVYIGNNYNNNGSPNDSDEVADALQGVTASGITSAMFPNPVATDAQKAIINNTSANSTTSCGTVNFPASNNHENSGFYADEWARYMLASDQKIVTYTIGLKGDGCKPEYAWLLNSMATVGEGKYFEAADYAALKKAIAEIASEIRSVNSVFAAVSLPVSVNSQGTYLNQVYVGMFRPDTDSKPRWYGNLKQYKMGYLGGVFRMLDADGTGAISSSGSEFIGECARSFWTPAKTAQDAYWTNFADANCTGYAAQSNTPDGNMVEKGGQGYMLRKASPAARVVKTCSATFTACTALTTFDTSVSIDTSSTLSATMVNWIRGQNTKGESGTLNSTTLTTADMRPSAHGDVVHSRPAAINFGTDSVPKVVVFYGGNDGILRAVNGNRTTTFTVSSTAVEAGAEYWSFMPPEFYSKIKRLYDNTPLIKTGTIEGLPKDYGVDGPITAYRTAALDAWVYTGLRRGGRAFYAFNVDKTSLEVTLKWKRGCGDTGTSNCSNAAHGDFTGIGQTWAPPKIFTAAGYTTSPLLIMGGGYDTTCEDATSCTASTTGNRIYLMDADTGVLKQTFTTPRSMVGDVTVVKDSSGNATYIYAADMGGNVYRISGLTANEPIGTAVPGSWTFTTIATLGCGATTTVTVETCTSPPNRKFMFAPDVVVDGTTNYVLIGSGDREKPTNSTNATGNYFFMIKDRPTVTADLVDTNNCGTGATKFCLNSLLPVTIGVTPSTTSLDEKKGWFLNLKANEQVVTAAITVFGTVYFTTHEPKAQATNTCSPNLGTARSYAISYLTGGNPNGSTTELPYSERDDAGLSPDPVAGKVTLDDGTTVPFVIGCKGPLEACQPTPPMTINNPAKIRSYWFIQK